MAVVVGSVLALLAIAMLARWAAARRAGRVRREEVRAAQLVGAADAERDEGCYHDAEQGGRKFVTVDEVIERVAAEQASAAQRSRRPAPRTRRMAEDTDQMSAFALRPPSPYPRSCRR